MNFPFERKQGDFLISTDQALLQIHRIHHFLSTEAYWCLDIPESVVRKAIEGSLCFGVYQSSGPDWVQVGYGRVVTDSASFAWICDVYVEKEFRGRGLSKFLIESILSHPAMKGLRRICLATKDAQGLYEKFGFETTKAPLFWMEIKDNEIYRKQSAD